VGTKTKLPGAAESGKTGLATVRGLSVSKKVTGFEPATPPVPTVVDALLSVSEAVIEVLVDAVLPQSA
jgi:hypothetical protein